MNIFDQFVLVGLTNQMKEIASQHALERTKNIIRQFVPQGAPLTPFESNYVGVIGELAVRKHLGLNINISSNYEDRQVDDGDLKFKNKVYDVKTDAIPWSIYNNLLSGRIKNYDRYGCRVFSAKHLHHLLKYSGGLIFCAFAIPDNSKATKVNYKPDYNKQNLRDEIVKNNFVLIIGTKAQNEIISQYPTWYTPVDPKGKSSQYNSPNYIFHHTDLTSIKEI